MTYFTKSCPCTKIQENHFHLIIDSYLSGWREKGSYYKLLSRQDLISWSIFVISCHSSGALCDEAVCCGLMEMELILWLNDLCCPGTDFISTVLFFFFWKPHWPSWLSLTCLWIRIIISLILKFHWNQCSECLHDILVSLCNNYASLILKSFD